MGTSWKPLVGAGAFSGAMETLLAACNTAASAVTEVSYTYPTFTPVPDIQVVQDAINNIVRAKYNLTLKLNPINAGSYDQKQKLAVAAGDVQDIVYAVPWTTNYYITIPQSPLVPLHHIFNKHTP